MNEKIEKLLETVLRNQAEFEESVNQSKIENEKRRIEQKKDLDAYKAENEKRQAENEKRQAENEKRQAENEKRIHRLEKLHEIVVQYLRNSEERLAEEQKASEEFRKRMDFLMQKDIKQDEELIALDKKVKESHAYIDERLSILMSVVEKHISSNHPGTQG